MSADNNSHLPARVYCRNLVRIPDPQNNAHRWKLAGIKSASIRGCKIDMHGPPTCAAGFQDRFVDFDLTVPKVFLVFDVREMYTYPGNVILRDTSVYTLRYQVSDRDY